MQCDAVTWTNSLIHLKLLFTAYAGILMVISACILKPWSSLAPNYAAIIIITGLGKLKTDAAAILLLVVGVAAVGTWHKCFTTD